MAKLLARPSSLVALAGALLLLGFLVYLGDRPPGQAQLLPAWPQPAGGPWFGRAGGWLPSFIHPFAFSLLTAAALAPSPLPRFGACAAWGALNAAFELGQLPQAAAWLDATLQESSLAPAMRDALADYFRRGRFDVADLLAIAFGSLAAAAVLELLHPRRADRAH